VNEKIYADDISYWKTSKNSADHWMAKTKKMIIEHGGIVISDLCGTINGRTAFMINFELENDHYRITFPCLPTRHGEELPAKIQAATLIYHEVKSRIMASLVLGNRSAFFQYLMLPSGRTASEEVDPQRTLEALRIIQLPSKSEMAKNVIELE
jgi:hypothetical protein